MFHLPNGYHCVNNSKVSGLCILVKTVLFMWWESISYFYYVFVDRVSMKGEWEYLDIILKRDSAAVGGFGFSIAGGIDNPITDLDHGIYVTRIAPNGCADRDGKLR